MTKKPVALIVTAVSGIKLVSDLEMLMKTIRSGIESDSKLKINGVNGKIRLNGEIAYEKTREQITRLVETFLTFI